MQIRLSTTLTLGALLFFATRLVSADAIRLQSGAVPTALLELYTSEGCSSCPPAETWLSRLKQSPKLWTDFVPVAFHVDYWDHLGWKDPFASKSYSKRQRAYADHWRGRSVYTPGFVLDRSPNPARGADDGRNWTALRGNELRKEFLEREWRGWFNRDELPHAENRSAGVLTARSEDGQQWTLCFQPVALSASSSFDFYAALLGFDLSSDDGLTPIDAAHRSEAATLVEWLAGNGAKSAKDSK